MFFGGVHRYVKLRNFSLLLGFLRMCRMLKLLLFNIGCTRHTTQLTFFNKKLERKCGGLQQTEKTFFDNRVK